MFRCPNGFLPPAIAILSAWFVFATSVVSAEEKPARVTDGILVLYTFDKSDNNLIQDKSGAGEPLNLRIETPRAVTWRGDRLIVNSSARITSVEPARKITSAVKLSGAITIEAWVKPNDARQAGPARIVSMSADPGQRNFTLGQDAGKYDIRLRTTSTDANGTPSISTPSDSLKSVLTHVVYTRAQSGAALIYLNGKQQTAQQVAGDLSGWSDTFHLSLANELTGDRPWQGELHLAAIYGRSLSADEVSKNFAAGVRPAIDYAALLPSASQTKVDFIKDVQPILRTHCFECHAAGNEEGGLNLGVRQRVLEGSDSGPVFVKGDSANSRLIHLISGLEKGSVMPPDGAPLKPEQVGILRAWIDQGAAWPDGADVLDPRTERARKHWAFQPLGPVTAPDVKQPEKARTPIDRFVLARLDAANLQSATPANPRELIRRIYFDVIGLPPTPDEIQQFSAAAERDRNAAVESLVDRMLQSEHYGERWGRHWLDVARYADSDGQESDRDRPNAYHYRDFVIHALIDDMPFDQFVRWQLAGDEFAPQNPSAVAATGFLVAGPYAALGNNLMADERLRNRYNELDDILSTVGTGMLGLTLGCARCHDHKYDAIPARDYYRLMSSFQTGDRAEVPLANTSDKALVWRDGSPTPKPTWLFRRGDFYDHDQPVGLGFVSILTRGKTPEEYWKQALADRPLKESTSQRRALADWMTDVDQGAGALVARVIVNRLWQHHFGSALVTSVGDFGVRSEPPTHPELLEWLARDLVQNGWKLKRLHRLILTSTVYQQASTGVATPALDPDNRLLWKMRPQRLEGEILRDTMLSVSGTLNLTAYGPGFKPPVADEAMVARNVQGGYPAGLKDSAAVRRRSVYMFHKRVVPYPLLQAFDKPDAQQSCGRRDMTTVAPQALALLNDPFVRMVSLDFAARLEKEAGDDPSAWIQRGFQLTLGRSPTETEQAAAKAFLEVQLKERQNRKKEAPANEVRRQALADLCQALFSLNEFIYID
jgi:mono/diheme cytochrome c family protein